MVESSSLNQRIRALKEERDAVIVAHNYQLPEVQDIADYTGDSLELAKKVTELDSELVVFCGVMFMAESAAILNPEKKIIIPDLNALCPMAAMVDVQGLRALKELNPGVPVVAYINTTAKVKTLADICCTSANALQVVESLDSDKVIFIPDTNLALYTQRFTDKEIIPWPGHCPTHMDIDVRVLNKIKEEHPGAEIMVHPECRPDVIDLADHVFSTQGMIDHALSSNVQEFIVGTEKEHVHRLRSDVPGKTFYPIERAVCPNMKKITLEKLHKALENKGLVVEIDDGIRAGAKAPLERMLALKRGK